MTETTKTSSNHPRGTIIVDSNFFIHAHASIPDEWKNSQLPNHQRFYEILEFLANNGFRILIPDETAYEVNSQFLHRNTLKCVDDYFDSGTDFNKRELVARARARKDYKNFFLRVTHHEIPNIEILPSDHLEGEAASFLRQIRAVLDRRPSSDRMGISSDIIKVARHTPHDLADRVIKRHVQILSAQSPEEQFYVLTFDKEVLEHVYSQNKGSKNVNVVGTVGFFKALKENNMLKHLGMQPDIDAVAIMNEVFRQTQDHDYAYNGFIDRSCTAPYNQNDRPFARAMKQLNKDLRSHNGHDSAGINGHDDHVPGTNGFTQRLANTPEGTHPRINPSTPYTGRH